MRTAMLLSLVVGLTAVGVAQSKSSSEKTMPAMVTNARWVLVRSLAGEQYARNITPEDRQAIAEVQQRIEEWGRYKLAYKEEDAEIILVVRRGAIVAAKPGVIIGSGTGFPSPVPRIGVSTETGPKDDMLAVYDARGGLDAAPLWRKIQPGGLLNEMPLFKEFKRAVEAAKKP